MTECSRVMHCRPADVYAVLADGWTYPVWVVGAARARQVDPGWPDPGTRIHHAVGVWPLLLHDTTQARASKPPHLLQLRARAWPTGEAHVEFRVDPHDEGTVVTLDERVVSGPAALVPGPLEAALLKWRNTETLRRLAFISEGRSRP